ncbi:MAG: glutamate--tRNA ligase [Bacteroidales bacterium]|nr:glutamate--tRNA ligase [Bacteroidales bacterium]
MSRKVRVRFAPSPTGPLHIGGVRTALFNYLFAKKNNGTFILRIEDTDQTRFVANAEKYIIESLEWCGLKFDEGIHVGGEYGPYRQSDRKAIYLPYAEKLIETGNAYYAFDTPEELNELRLQGEAQKNLFVYNAITRKNLKNSITLNKEEVTAKLQNGDAYVIRFKLPENEDIHVFDEIRKEVTFNTKELDDKVLFKSDGMPTYHLANVVDDFLMQITHVIRGEEWLPSLPLHVLLYKALGWQDAMPSFSHLPLILKPQGQGKLSKRDGEKLGFPVFPLLWHGDNDETSAGYREDGYLPEAFINMLALLGWNPGTEQEIFTMDELINSFSLERVGKSGSKFDPDKTKWFNQQWIQRTDNAVLAKAFAPILVQNNVNAEIQTIEKIVGLVKERAVFIKDLWEHSEYFFKAPNQYDPKIVSKRWSAEVPQILNNIIEFLARQDDFSASHLEEKLKSFIAENNYNLGQVMNCLRLVIVGGAKGTHLFDIFEIIGKEETIKRIQKGIETIKI